MSDRDVLKLKKLFAGVLILEAVSDISKYDDSRKELLRKHYVLCPHSSRNNTD